MTIQPPTTAGTWEPDLYELALASMQRLAQLPDVVEKGLVVEVLIAEYQRQAAAAGLVMVRRDFLAQTKEMVDWLMGTCTAMGSDQAVYDELVALAATPESAAGGEAG